MKTKLSNRVLAMVLSILMCVSLFPAQVFAEEADFNESTEEAVVETEPSAEEPVSPATDEVPAAEETAVIEEAVSNEAANTVVASGNCGLRDNPSAVTWVLDAEGTLTITGTGNMYSGIYPGEISWNSYTSDIKAVVIADGVTNIGMYAFYDCSSLQSVSIPASVTTIGDYAFQSCSSLTDISIPSGLTSIGDFAFNVCSSIKNIELPAGLVTIGQNAFSGCTSLQSVNIPASLTDIGSSAFSGCTSLEEITVDEANVNYCSEDGVLFAEDKSELICCPAGKAGTYLIPSNVITIAANAFSGCSGLTGITIPDSVTTIGDGAFASCSGLTTIEIPSGVTRINTGMFTYCTGLTEVVIPSTVETIGGNAFLMCSSLTDIDLPEGLTTIEYGAFIACSALTGIIIPARVTSIGTQAFQSCSSLREITIADGNTSYCFEDSVLFNIDKTELVQCVMTKQGDYLVPDSVTTIKAFAFADCNKLTGITVPASVSNIEMSAFNSCTALESITFLGNAPTLGERIFNRDKLTAYYPADNDTWTSSVMQQYAGTVEWESYTASAEMIASGTCGAEGDGSNLTWTLDSEGTLTISGSGKMTDWTGGQYDKAPWNSYSSQIKSVVIKDGVTSIGSIAFQWCQNIKNVTFSDSVTSIGKQAFMQCGNLKEVTISDAVSSIGAGAFCWCTALTDITVDADNTVYCSVDGVLFDKAGTTVMAFPGGRTGTYSVSDGVVAIADYAFFGSSLSAISLPDSLGSIGTSAFGYCTSLKEITIPDSVTSIGSSAFEWCTALTGITVPANVTSIGVAAFNGCTSVTTINVDEANTVYSSVDGVLFSKDKTTLIGFPCGKTGSYTVPQGVTKIGERAFNVSSLDSLTFTGNAPEFESYAFGGVSDLTVYYPANNNTWTSYVMQQYGGTVEWESYTPSVETIASGNCGQFNKDTEEYSDCVTWTLDSEGTLTISGTGAMGNYGYDEASYSNIEMPWVDYKSQIQSVTINEGVTAIGRYAFSGCTNLTCVTLPASLNEIRGSAFSGCTGLTAVTIPAGVSTISTGAFNGCTGLTAFGVEEYNENFCTVDGVIFSKDEKTLILYPVGRTGEYTVPSGTEEIGEGAFCCSTITSVILPDSVTTLGLGAFASCRSLTEVTLPSGLASIPEQAFYYCVSLTNVEIPSSVTSIGEGAFMTSGLTEVEIPAGVTSIGGYAFAYNSKLTEIAIPAGVTEIGEDAFQFCDSLTAVNVDEQNEAYSSIDGVLFNKDQTLLVYYPCNREGTDYSIPDGVQIIEQGAFCHTINLRTVTIPASVNKIGLYAFAWRSPSTLTFLGNAPEFVIGENDRQDQFYGTNKTVYYPADNETWDSVIGNDYGASSIDWESYSTLAAEVVSVTIDGQTENYTTFAAAADAANSAGTAEITLLADIDLADESDSTSGITISNGSYTLDWNGYTLSHSNLADDGAVLNFVDCELVLDGGAGGVQAPEVDEDKLMDDIYNYAITVSNSGDQSVTINGGHYYGEYSLYANLDCGNVYVNDGTFDGDFKTELNSDDSSTHIACGTFNGILRAGSLGSFIIDDGSFESLGGLANTNVTINGGEFPYGLQGYFHQLKINGGTFNGLYFYYRHSDDIMIKGGTFNLDESGSYSIKLEDEDAETSYTASVESLIYPFAAVSAPVSSVSEREYYEGMDYYIYYNYSPNAFTVSYDPDSSISGTCGDDLTWTLNGEGTLTISGTGAMTDWNYFYSVPWYSYRLYVKTVVIGDGVTSVGNYAFCGCNNLTVIKFNGDAPTIGSNSFGPYSEGDTEDYENELIVRFPINNTTWNIDGTYNVDIMRNYYGRTVWNWLGWDDLTWELSEDGTLTISGTGEMGEYNTTTVCAPWKETNAASIKKVVIGEGVTSVGGYAFSGCHNLTEVTLPDGIKWIAYDAFKNDESLTSINIPDSVTIIGNMAFLCCESLEGITIPASVTKICTGAFENCTGLTEVTFLGNAPTIQDYVFGSDNLTAWYPEGNDSWNSIINSEDNQYGGTVNWESYTASAEIIASGTCGAEGDNLTWQLDNEGVLTVSGNGAMAGWGWYSQPWYDYSDSIISVVIDEGVTTIGDYAFCSYDKLESLNLSDTVTGIGYYAFFQCSNLGDVTIPAAVESIDTFAFNGNRSLQNFNVAADNAVYSSVDGVLFDKAQTTLVKFPGGRTGGYEIPAGVTAIGEKAFHSCRLTTLTIPAGVTEIGDFALSNCSNMTAIQVDSGNAVYSSVDGVLFDKAQETLLRCPAGRAGTYEIPSGVTAIGNEAFTSCRNLTGVTIPDSVKTIDVNAFCVCTGLTEIMIPASVTSIARGAFQSCYNLKSVTFEGSAPDIGASAFANIYVNASYPGNDKSWTSDVLQGYGGNIIWKAVFDEITIDTGDETEATVSVTVPENTSSSTVPDAVKENIDEDVADHIQNDTSVSGVQLAKTDSATGNNGAQVIVTEAAKDNETLSQAIAAPAENKEVSISVEVQVTTVSYTAPAEGTTGKVEFALEPVATVTVTNDDEAPVSAEVEVTNDMIDTTGNITVNLYTGFKPEQIIHTDDAGNIIEIFSGSAMTYDDETGIVTLTIHHFSNLTVYAEADAQYSHNGDCNGDGVVNLKDLLELKKALAQDTVSELKNQEGADIDGFDGVNLKDLLMLKQKLANA